MPNSYSTKRNQLEKQLDSIEVLVLGNSQMLYGVNPQYFRLKGYNLADVSQTIYYDAQLTAKYIDKMPRLKYLIISVYYVSFGEQLYDGIENWRDYCYSQYWDIDYHQTKIFDLGRYSKIFLYTPRNSIYYLRHHFKINLIEGLQPNGYMWKDSSSYKLNISPESGFDRVREHNGSYFKSRKKEIVADLAHLLDLANQHHVVPIIITPPVYKTYFSNVNTELINQNQQTIDGLCQIYHCRYKNYFSDGRFLRTDFYDNDHLNFIGAQKFSQLLDSELMHSSTSADTIRASK